NPFSPNVSARRLPRNGSSSDVGRLSSDDGALVVTVTVTGLRLSSVSCAWASRKNTDAARRKRKSGFIKQNYRLTGTTSQGTLRATEDSASHLPKRRDSVKNNPS